MSTDRTYVEGTLYVRLETVAEIYCVDILWLRQVIDGGLLPPVAPGCALLRTSLDGVEHVAAVTLERVAVVVRMHRVLGLDIDQILGELHHIDGV